MVDGAKTQTGIKVNYIPLNSDPNDPCDQCSFNCVMLLNLERDQGETINVMVIIPHGGGVEKSRDSVGYVSDDVYVHWIHFFVKQTISLDV